jgi:putative hemolysin
LKELIEPPLYIPENMTAFNLLEKFRESKSKVAIVIDEYGAVQGMVTMTDLVDALVGDMDAPTTPEETEIVIREDGSYLIDALIPFDEFVDYFKIENEVEEEDTSGFHTLGGFILHLNEEIPRTGAAFFWKHFSFEVVDMDGNRIDKILVRNSDPSDQGEEG